VKGLILPASTLSLVFALAACADQHPSQPDKADIVAPPSVPAATPPAPAGTIISDPVSNNGLTGLLASSSSTNVAYVSAVPGSFPDFVAASLRNETKQTGLREFQLSDGGFDPVGIEAVVDDRLLLSIIRPNGAAVSYVIVVPPRRNPGVIRTSPSKGRVDVALNVQIEVVFSEPIDKATVSSTTIVLRGPDGAAVDASINLSNDGLAATLTPAQPLEQGTGYTLVVTQGVRDLDGDPLIEAISSSFSTILVEPPASPALTGKILFDMGGDIYRANADGSDVVNLTGYAWWSNHGGVWSPDGKEIAFLSARNGTPPCQVCAPDGDNIFVMREDGSHVVGIVARGSGGGLAWSPDGRKLAFTTYWFENDGRTVRNDIAIVEVGIGESSIKYLPLDSRVYPSNLRWSPDGKMFAFDALEPSTMPSFFPWTSIYVMNVDGSGLRKILSGGDPIPGVHIPAYFGFTWSPNGKSISVSVCELLAFGWIENCDWAYTGTGNFDGTTVSNIKFLYTGVAFTSQWSPDGDKIVFPRDGGTAYVTRDGFHSGMIINKGNVTSWHQ